VSAGSPIAGLGGQLLGVQVGGAETTLPRIADAITESPPVAAGATTPSSLDEAIASLTAIEASYQGIDVLAAIPNQEYDATNTLIDTMQVSWRLLGRPGVFTTSVPYVSDWQALAFFHIGLDAQNVELIYEGAPDMHSTPTVYLVPPPAVAPTPLPSPGVNIPA
jgi:hypothetical protein